MIKANNVAAERRVAVAAAYLRNIAADWYKADKTNITQYADRNVASFIRWIKARFISDA